nr:hypothetical protein [Tanacetum cinerariifolium]
MGDEHLNTIPATGSDEVINSSVEDLVPIPSESEGIPEHMCDVPFHDNSSPLDVSKDQIEDFSESINKVSSIDDDSFSIDNIDFIKASPLDSELLLDYVGATQPYLGEASLDCVCSHGRDDKHRLGVQPGLVAKRI